MNFRHALRAMYVSRLNIIFASNIVHNALRRCIVSTINWRWY